MSRALLPILPSAVAMLFAAYAAVCDLRTRRIPNRLVLLCLPAALLSQFAVASWKGVADGLAAAAVALLLMSVGFLLGGVGAGDVKWMSVMAACSGLHALPLLMAVTSLAGGACGLFWIVRSRCARLLSAASAHGSAMHCPLTIPYALPIACGVFAVFLQALRGPA